MNIAEEKDKLKIPGNSHEIFGKCAISRMLMLSGRR